MLTVVVPYRNRPEHFRVFIPSLAMFLTKRNIQHRILVVHQADDLPFNRGALLNIGFLECESDSDFVCFHDIDMLPEDDSCEYGGADGPTHLAGSVEQFGFRLPYASYCGGVLVLPAGDFRKINGFANEYWGWGREDDDLYLRLVANGCQLHRKPGRYRSLDHRRNVQPVDLSANSHRLLATLLYVSESLPEGSSRELVEPIRQLCERYCTLPVQPRSPLSDGLTTTRYSEVSRSPLALKDRNGVVCATHQMISVRLHRSHDAGDFESAGLARSHRV